MELQEVAKSSQKSGPNGISIVCQEICLIFLAENLPSTFTKLFKACTPAVYIILLFIS